MKLIVDLMYEGGIENMSYSISDTAQWGDFVSWATNCHDASVKAEMKEVLKDIQEGKFAKGWILENQANRPNSTAIKKVKMNTKLKLLVVSYEK